MNKKSFSQIRIGGTRLLIQILYFLFCSQAIFAQAPKIKFKIKDTPDSIFVTARFYTLSIDKINAYAHLKNWQGISYTSFPLDVQYNLVEIRDTLHINRQWKIKDKKITSTATIDGFVVQEIKITCSDNAFEIQINSLLNQDLADNGAYLLRRNDNGFNTADWDQYFSPEPDDYFKSEWSG